MWKPLSFLTLCKHHKFWFSLFTAWKGSSTFFFSCLTAIFNSLSSKFSTDCVNAEGCEEGAVTMSPIPLRFDYNGNSPPLCVIRSPRCAKGQRLLGFPCRSKLYFKKPNACSTFQSQLIWSEKTCSCPFFCHRLDFFFPPQAGKQSPDEVHNSSSFSDHVDYRKHVSYSTSVFVAHPPKQVGFMLKCKRKEKRKHMSSK